MTSRSLPTHTYRRLTVQTPVEAIYQMTASWHRHHLGITEAPRDCSSRFGGVTGSRSPEMISAGASEWNGLRKSAGTSPRGRASGRKLGDCWCSPAPDDLRARHGQAPGGLIKPGLDICRTREPKNCASGQDLLKMTRGRVHAAFTAQAVRCRVGQSEELRSSGRKLCFSRICLASARPAHIQDLVCRASVGLLLLRGRRRP